MCYTRRKIEGGLLLCGSLMIQTFRNPMANLETSMSMLSTMRLTLYFQKLPQKH